jgi:hypothetical protein
MLNLKPLLFLCVLALSAFAQGNLQVNVTHSGDQWSIRNASTQPITAYVDHGGDEQMHVTNGANVGVIELKNDPMLPGTSKEIPIVPGIQKVEIVAVVFDDGHVSGAASTVEGIDLVQSAIFDNRKLELAEWKNVAAQLAAEPSHRKAFDDVFNGKASEPSANPGPEENARHVVQDQVRGLSWIAAKQRTAELRYQNLIAAVNAKVTAAERLATRRVK